MWCTVLVIALMAASDPARLGMVLLVISRERPMRSLAAVWLGSMSIGIPLFIILLVLVRGPGSTLTQHIGSAAGGSTARHVKIAIGLVILSIAAVIAARLSRRRGAQAPMAVGALSPAALQPDTSTAASLVSRLFARFRDVLKRGGLRMAFGAGLASGPPWHDAVLAISITAASGAALATQVSVVIVFLLVMLALIEIPLISYLIAPAKSEAFVLTLLNWMGSHRRQILAAMLAVAGSGLVATSIA